jgi:ADP-ribose pyrophosphatase
MSKFKEIKISGQIVYSGFIRIHRDEILLPDGNPSVREYVWHPGAAMIIPILPNGNVIMERQFRYCTNEEYLEFPAGKLDPGENPLEAAHRELLEETGYVAEEIKHLTTIHPVIGYSNERIEIFVAKNLTYKEQKLDEGEFLEVVEISPIDLIELVRNSQIKDVKTQVGAFWLEKILQQNW